MSAGAALSPVGDGPAPADELPRPPGLLRRWVDAHPRTVDLLLALATQGALLPLALIVAAFDTSISDSWWSLTATLVTAIALGYGTYSRRRMPFALLLAALCALLLPSPRGCSARSRRGSPCTRWACSARSDGRGRASP